MHLADNTTIQAKAVGTLPLSSELSLPAKEAHVFSELKHPLLSLGQLCDDDCDILLTKTKLVAKKNNNNKMYVCSSFFWARAGPGACLAARTAGYRTLSSIRRQFIA